MVATPIEGVGRHGENTLRQGYVIEKPELSGAAGAVTKRTPRADRSGKEEAGGSAPPGSHLLRRQPHTLGAVPHVARLQGTLLPEIL